MESPVLNTYYRFENLYGSLLELNLCMKDCQGSYTMFFVSEDFSGYIYLESLTYFLFLAQHWSRLLGCYQVALNWSSPEAMLESYGNDLFLMEIMIVLSQFDPKKS